MKTAYAVILVIGCITLVIVGWYGLMNTSNTTTIAPTKDTSENDQFSKAVDKVEKTMERADGITTTANKSNSSPLTIPILAIIIGGAGACYGGYQVVKNLRPQSATTPETKNE